MERFEMVPAGQGRNSRFGPYGRRPAIHDELFRLFGELAGMPFFGERPGCVIPGAALFREDGKIVVEVEVPGIEPDSLDLRVYPDRIVLASREGDGENPGQDAGPLPGARRCRRFFRREMALPVEVDPDMAEASVKNGVLRVLLAERNRADAGRRIELKPEGKAIAG